MMRRGLMLMVVLCMGWSVPARADLPEWLRKHNSDVDSGNEALNKGDAKGALEAYTRAARMLPDAPGVALDRGIAQLKQGDFAKAREALLSATVPNASSDVRADAYHNLALSFYREADGLAGENKHADAQKLFREAVDAAKRSLHLRPSDPNTAWNLELSARRMREEEQKKKEEDEQKEKDKQNQDQNQDQQNQDDQQKQDDQQQDQKNDQQKQDDQQNQKQDDKQKPEPDKNKPEQDQPKQDEQQPQDQPQDQAPEQALPREAEQALDSLENNEENYERHRARQRANRERRAPEKDW